MSYANFITTLNEIVPTERNSLIFEAIKENKNDLIEKKSTEFCYEISDGGLFNPLYRPRIGRIYPSQAKKIQENKEKFIDTIKQLNDKYCITKILFILFENDKPAIEIVKINFDDFIQKVIDDTIKINTICKIERDYQDFQLE